MRKFLFFGVTGLLLILGIFFINLFAPDEVVNTHTQSYLIPQGINSQQIRWNGDALIDSTVIDDASNTCTAERNGMKIEIKPCVAFDLDGRDLEQFVNFTWKGNNEQNIGWVFVYDGQLQQGGISAILNYSHTETRVRTVNNWVNNYLVSNVVSYTDLGTPDDRCEMGNTNNTRMYDVTHQNATATYNKVYCFTSSVVVNATAFRISGNYNTEEYYAYTSFYPDWKDVTSAVEFLGVGLLDDNRSYYKVQSTTFQPNQSLYTRWSYTPKDNLKQGKWHILGYNADIGLVASLTSGQYIYVDPWWNNDWDRKKEIKVQDITGNTWTNYSVYLDVTYDADMSANFSDLRFLDATETYEIPYYIETKTDSTSAKVWVKTPLTASSNTSIYMYYGNPAVSTTGNKTAAFLWNDDAEADWMGRYTVVGGTPNIWNYTGSEYNFQGANTDLGHTIYPTGLNCSNCSVFAEVRDVVSTFYVAGMIMRTTGSNNGYKIQKVSANLDAREIDVSKGAVGTGSDGVYFNATVWAFGTTINYTGQGASTGSLQVTDATFSSGYGGWWNSDDGIARFKRLRIRQYMSPEPAYVIGEEQTAIGITVTQSTNDNFNTTDITPNLRCNFTAVSQNISSVKIFVYDINNNLDYTNTDSSLNVVSYNKTWTLTTLTDDTYNWSCIGYGSLGINGTSANRTFTLDSTSPAIYGYNITSITSLAFPAQSYWWADINDTHIKSCWYYTSDNSTNVTINCNTNSSARLNTNWTSYGAKYINIWGNDTFGNTNNKSYSLSISNITLSLNAPADNYKSSNPLVTFNCTAGFNPATALANITLYIDGSSNESLQSNCGSTCEGLSIQKTASLNQSSHTWYCTAINKINDDTITATPRSIIIDYTNPAIVGYNITNLSGQSLPSSFWWLNVTDSNTNVCWYHTNENLTNTTIACNATQTARLNTSWTSYGNKYIRIYSNDTIGNLGTAYYPLTISNLSTSLISPANETWQSSTSVGLSCKADLDPIALNNISLYVDGTIEQTNTSSGTAIYLTKTVTGLSQGTHTWYCIGGNREAGTTTQSSIREFYVDSVAPTSTILNVTNLTSRLLDKVSRINISASDVTSTPICYYNSTQDTTLNATSCNSIIIINWTTPGYKTFQLRVNDSANNIYNNFGYLAYKLYNLTSNYSSTIIEGESSEFTLRMNTTPIAQGAVYADLIYDGVNRGYDSRTVIDDYTSIITKTLSIPSGSGNTTGKSVSLYWNISSENISTVAQTQKVYSIALSNCTTEASQIIYNFTLYNEVTKAQMASGVSTNLTTTMEAFLYSSQYTSINWTSNTTSSNSPSFQLCVNPGWLSGSIANKLDLKITYDAEGYSYENYNEQASIVTNSTVPKQVSLYLSPETATEKTFKINVKDSSLNVVTDAVVEIYRYYQGTAITELIEAPTTDSLGNAIGHLVLSDVEYKIIIRKNGIILGTFNKIKVTETSVCSASYNDCFINLQLTTDNSQFSNFDNYLQVGYNYSYDDSTRVITLKFESKDGTAKTVSLNVTSYYTPGTSICYSTTSAISDTLTCSIPSNINGTIISTTKVGDKVLSRVLNKVTPKKFISDIDSLRIFLLALLIPVFVIMGASSAGMALIFMFIGLVLIFASGLLNTDSWTGGASIIVWIIVCLFLMFIKIKKGGSQNG